jgi:hypothetical protein
VTSLALLGCDVTRERALDVVLAHLVAHLELACHEPARIAADYARASELPGRTVRIRRGSCELTGRLEALTLAGLELAPADGARMRIPSSTRRPSKRSIERGARGRLTSSLFFPDGDKRHRPGGVPSRMLAFAPLEKGESSNGSGARSPHELEPSP